MNEGQVPEIDDPGLISDLRSSVGVWRAHPWLVLLPLLVWGASTLVPTTEPWLVLSIPLTIFLTSEPGIERVWYLRAFRDKPMTPPDVWRLFAAFFWRYFRLGCLFSIPFMVVLFVSAQFGTHDRAGQYVSPSWFLPATALMGLVVDLILTFVTPAMAFTTDRVREALRLGVGMIRQQWPRSMPYVAIPPLAVLVLSRIWWRDDLPAAALVSITVVSVLMNLAFKGATARFYLRRHDCGDDGSAHLVRVPSVRSPDPDLPNE